MFLTLTRKSQTSHDAMGDEGSVASGRTSGTHIVDGQSPNSRGGIVNDIIPQAIAEASGGTGCEGDAAKERDGELV